MKRKGKIMNDKKKIYLEPVCQNEDCEHYDSDDRSWCVDDAWGADDCDGCGEDLPLASVYILEEKIKREK